MTFRLVPHRLRLILPPTQVLFWFAVTVVILESPAVLGAFLGQPPWRQGDADTPALILLRISSIGYGVWRICGFHPAYRGNYRRWLERTPWGLGKPLPAGPISLTWADLLPIAAILIPSGWAGLPSAYVGLGLILLGHSVALAPTMWVTGVGAFGYAILFGVGLAVRLWPDPLHFLLAMAATYVVGQFGLRASLARFPWPDMDQQASQIEFDPATGAIRTKTCGWPFDQLRPSGPTPMKGTKRDGFLVGLLMGWYLFAIQSILPDRATQHVISYFALGGSVLLLSLLRTAMYVGPFAPPITLWGRLRTGRLILPKYDRAFLAPICTLLVGLLGFDRFRPPGLDDLVFLPIALAVAWGVALTTGPSPTQWALTGMHRVREPVAGSAGELVKVG